MHFRRPRHPSLCRKIAIARRSTTCSYAVAECEAISILRTLPRPLSRTAPPPPPSWRPLGPLGPRSRRQEGTCRFAPGRPAGLGAEDVGDHVVADHQRIAGTRPQVVQSAGEEVPGRFAEHPCGGTGGVFQGAHGRAGIQMQGTLGAEVALSPMQIKDAPTISSWKARSRCG